MIKRFQRFIEEEPWEDEVDRWWDILTVCVAVIAVIGAIFVFGPVAVKLFLGGLGL